MVRLPPVCCLQAGSRQPVWLARYALQSSAYFFADALRLPDVVLDAVALDADALDALALAAARLGGLPVSDMVATSGTTAAGVMAVAVSTACLNWSCSMFHQAAGLAIGGMPGKAF
jgi:hypothetical protein